MVKDIYGQKVKYFFKKMPEDTDGEYCAQTKIISISNRLKGDARTLTVLHEELHGILDRLGFNDVLREDIEELLVDMISQWIIENYTLTPRK